MSVWDCAAFCDQILHKNEIQKLTTDRINQEPDYFAILSIFAFNSSILSNC